MDFSTYNGGVTWTLSIFNKIYFLRRTCSQVVHFCCLRSSYVGRYLSILRLSIGDSELIEYVQCLGHHAWESW